METIFGAEIRSPPKVLLALLIVIGLLVCLLSGEVCECQSVSAPPPIPWQASRALAVIEVAGVDPRRRLVLIRRDNVEHSIMIGARLCCGRAKHSPRRRSGCYARNVANPQRQRTGEFCAPTGGCGLMAAVAAGACTAAAAPDNAGFSGRNDILADAAAIGTRGARRSCR